MNYASIIVKLPLWMRHAIMRESIDRSKILLALDTLSCALADHNHIWTDEDRHIYDQAIKELGIDVNS